MSIFGSILSKIFPSSHPAVAAGGTPAAAPASGAAPTSPAPSDAGAPQSASGGNGTPASAPAPTVDVEQVLTEKAEQSGEQLNWRTSIVDLMKLLNLDSSLTARKQLAQELHYSGDTNDSATMNIWLHKEVMTQLAANGGKVPDDLKR